MQRMQGSYALIQYSPVPERMEFVNVGVLLHVAEFRFLEVKFAAGHSRVDRVFGRSNAQYLQKLKQGLASRLRAEFSGFASLEALAAFAAKRANELRISPFLPVAVVDPAQSLEKLFSQLVGDDVSVQRRPPMARRLRDVFRKEGVFARLEENPPEIVLPEAGIRVRAAFGYQNGAYTMIDGARLSGDRGLAMQQAGKRALEGGMLAKHSERSGDRKRLVVVGDFEGQPLEFYQAVDEQLSRNSVKLYRFDNLRPLFDDIERNALMHGH